MQNYREDNGLSGSDEESVELKQKVAKFEQQLAENYEQIEKYANAPAVSRGLADLDGDGIVSFDDQGEGSQRSQVADNNRLLIIGNGAFGEPLAPSMSSSGPAVAGPGSGTVPQVDFTAPNTGDSASTTDSKSLAGYALSIKGDQKPQTRGAMKKGAEEQQVDRINSGTRLMRRQQSLSNVFGLNDFVDFNNGNMPIEQSVSGAIPGSGGAMGGGGGFGSGVPQKPDNSDPFRARFSAVGQVDLDSNSPVDESLLAERHTLRVNEAMLDHSGRGGGTGFVTTPEWTKVGGLSLPIDIPVAEQSLSFSRVGGEPKLALQIRSRELVDTGVGFVWTLVWLGIALTLIVTFSRVSTARELFRPAVWILFVGGLLSFLILPGVFSGLGFVAFLLGLLALASRFIRSGRTA